MPDAAASIKIDLALIVHVVMAAVAVVVPIGRGISIAGLAAGRAALRAERAGWHRAEGVAGRRIRPAIRLALRQRNGRGAQQDRAGGKDGFQRHCSISLSSRDKSRRRSWFRSQACASAPQHAIQRVRVAGV